MGVTDKIEIGSYITKDPNANYDFFGLDARYTEKLEQGGGLNLAGRISHTRLHGPEDLNFYSTGVDVLTAIGINR